MTTWNDVETRRRTPAVPAGTVVTEHADHWTVRCEGGCGLVMGVKKVRHLPVDPTASDPFAATVREELTAPEAIRCAGCGPFLPDDL